MQPHHNFKEKLPYGTDAHDTAQRAKIWAGFDVNGNGYISLAEVDKGMRDIVCLPELFELKPVLIRAFTAAKTALKSKNPHGDDYVSKSEFRYLLKYLCQYYEYWQVFAQLDKNNDRKITPAEFSVAVPVLNKWGVHITDANAAFKQIDTNHGGVILFDEFCNWAIKKNLAADTEPHVV